MANTVFRKLQNYFGSFSSFKNKNENGLPILYGKRYCLLVFYLLCSLFKAYMDLSGSEEDGY